MITFFVLVLLILTEKPIPGYFFITSMICDTLIIITVIASLAYKFG